MSRGPSLQSLVKSFINRVSRGTQTDCDDNFDLVSIASVTSGFSAIASDLSQSRLKLFLNDGHQNQLNSSSTRQTKSYASSQVDDNEFVEELQKLRDEINGEFGGQVSEKYTTNQFDMEDLSEEPVSVQSQKEAVSLIVPSKVRTFVDAQMLTDTVLTKNSYTQTEQPKRVEKAEKAVETEKPLEMSKVSTTQTSVPTSPEKMKPQMKECETQTEQVRFCDHNCELINNKDEHSLVPNGNVVNHQKETPPAPQPTTIIVQHAPPPPPQIMKCEFLISVWFLFFLIL